MYAIYLGLLLVVAIALLFSTVTSTALAAVGTVCSSWPAASPTWSATCGTWSPPLPTASSDALYFALPNFRNFDFKDRVTYGEPVPWADLGLDHVLHAVYITALLGVGLAFFRRREFQ